MKVWLVVVVIVVNSLVEIVCSDSMLLGDFPIYACCISHFLYRPSVIHLSTNVWFEMAIRNVIAYLHTASHDVLATSAICLCLTVILVIIKIPTLVNGLLDDRYTANAREATLGSCQTSGLQ